MNSQKVLFLGKTTLMSVFLLALAGCGNPFGQKNSKAENVSTADSASKTSASLPGAVIVTYNDGKVLTMGDLDNEVAKVLASHPYMKNMDPAQIDLGMKEMFLKNIINRVLVERWADENNIEKNADFQKDLQQTLAVVVQAKKAEFFENKVRSEIAASVSDRDVKTMFEKNKNRYVKIAGGVMTSAIKFANREEAKAFLESLDVAKVQTVVEFELAAKKSDLVAKNFGQISEQAPRGAHQAIVDEATSRRTFPSVELIKVGDDEFWVAFFEKKQDTVFFEFDEIKKDLRLMAENEKFGARVESEIKTLQDKYIKNIDLSAFKSAGEPSLADLGPVMQDEASFEQE